MPATPVDSLPRLYRSDAIRVIERAAMQHFGLDEDALMLRAATAAWRVLLDRWPKALRIGIACGPGNNGGDGYALARIARASGRDVRVIALPGNTARESAGARAAEAFLGEGGVAVPFAMHDGVPRVDVWVDALFGIGLHRALEGEAADLVEALNRSCIPILSLDVPSGIDADTGASPGACVRATATLAFIAGKCGLYTGEGRSAAGGVLVDRLGLDPVVFDDVAPAAVLARPDALARWLKPRPRNAHKGQFGHVLCVGGDHGFGGAIALCAQAALRSGAGLVSVATRADHVPALIASRPEVMARAVEQSSEFTELLARASVVAVGPGLGQGDWGRALLEAALVSGEPLVIDADGLNLLGQHLGGLGDAVLTPHPGEASRLLDTPIRELERDRIGSAEALARQSGCAVVWKGSGTVVAAPGEVPVIIDAGNPGMASGGMGDVLTGVIAALRAQDWSAFEAAACGALLHAAAGDAAAAEGGERGLLASDLFPHLRRLANPCS